MTHNVKISERLLPPVISIHSSSDKQASSATLGRTTSIVAESLTTPIIFPSGALPKQKTPIEKENNCTIMALDRLLRIAPSQWHLTQQETSFYQGALLFLLINTWHEMSVDKTTMTFEGHRLFLSLLYTMLVQDERGSCEDNRAIFDKFTKNIQDKVTNPEIFKDKNWQDLMISFRMLCTSTMHLWELDRSQLSLNGLFQTLRKDFLSQPQGIQASLLNFAEGLYVNLRLNLQKVQANEVYNEVIEKLPSQIKSNVTENLKAQSHLYTNMTALQHQLACLDYSCGTATNFLQLFSPNLDRLIKDIENLSITSKSMESVHQKTRVLQRHIDYFMKKSPFTRIGAQLSEEPSLATCQADLDVLTKFDHRCKAFVRFINENYTGLLSTCLKDTARMAFEKGDVRKEEIDKSSWDAAIALPKDDMTKICALVVPSKNVQSGETKQMFQEEYRKLMHAWVNISAVAESFDVLELLIFFVRAHIVRLKDCLIKQPSIEYPLEEEVAMQERGLEKQPKVRQVEQIVAIPEPEEVEAVQAGDPIEAAPAYRTLSLTVHHYAKGLFLVPFQARTVIQGCQKDIHDALIRLSASIELYQLALHEKEPLEDAYILFFQNAAKECAVLVEQAITEKLLKYEDVDVLTHSHSMLARTLKAKPPLHNMETTWDALLAPFQELMQRVEYGVIFSTRPHRVLEELTTDRKPIPGSLSLFSDPGHPPSLEDVSKLIIDTVRFVEVLRLRKQAGGGLHNVFAKALESLKEEGGATIKPQEEERKHLGQEFRGIGDALQNLQRHIAGEKTLLSQDLEFHISALQRRILAFIHFPAVEFLAVHGNDLLQRIAYTIELAQKRRMTSEQQQIYANTHNLTTLAEVRGDDELLNDPMIEGMSMGSALKYPHRKAVNSNKKISKGHQFLLKGVNTSLFAPELGPEFQFQGEVPLFNPAEAQDLLVDWSKRTVQVLNQLVK